MAERRLNLSGYASTTPVGVSLGQGSQSAVFALYHLGMVPGILDLKGFAKAWIFMTFLGVKNANKNMKMQDGHGRILVSGALDPRNMISPKITNISRGDQPKKPKC